MRPAHQDRQDVVLTFRRNIHRFAPPQSSLSRIAPADRIDITLSQSCSASSAAPQMSSPSTAEAD